MIQTMHSRESKYAAWSLCLALAATSPALAQAPVEPTAEPSTEPEVVAAPDATAEAAELRATLARLEARLAAVEAAAPAPEPETEPEAPVEAAPQPSWWERSGLRVGGYIQTQLVTSQFSHDEIGPDGSPLNQDRFVVRRGRLRLDGSWEYASAAFEIDASTTRGPFVGIRRAEASFFYPNRDSAGAVPYIRATVGLTSVPFGSELMVSNRDRWFLERSTGSLAFQRGEPDIGVRLDGGVGPFRYAFAVMNGNPLDDRPGGEPIDLTRAKDLLGRVGIETRRENRFELIAGVSFHTGRGLHQGTPASKPTLLWSDDNQNGVVDLAPINEITVIPGVAATPSIGFDRWGVNADLSVGFHTSIGWTRIYGEVTLGSNLDRSLYIADPVTNGSALREVAWFAAVLQEVTRYGIVGLRVDRYDPNSDFLDQRRGTYIPSDASIFTISPMIGGQLPGRGRLVFQYDRIRDHLGRDASGVPTDLRNDQFILRLQLEL